MYCSSCGREIRDNDLFCGICGSINILLAESDGAWNNAFCASCGVMRQGKYCAVCGKRMTANPNVFPQQKEPAPSAYPEYSPANPEKKPAKKTVGMIAAAGALALALLVSAAVVLVHRCDNCENLYFGLPHKAVLSSGDTQRVCGDCFEALGERVSETVQTTVTQASDGVNATAQQMQAAQEENRIGELSDETIRLANIFLSDFSELGIRSMNRNDAKAVLDYAIGHDLANYEDYTLLSPDEQFTAYNPDAGGEVKYILSIPAEVVRKKAERFFGEAPADQSTDRYYYADGQYYSSKMPAETHPYFSSVYQYTDNGDGTVVFLYKVFAANHLTADGFSDREVYKGTAQTKENDPAYTYCYTARAVLRKADVGKGYAPYRMVSIDLV